MLPTWGCGKVPIYLKSVDELSVSCMAAIYVDAADDMLTPPGNSAYVTIVAHMVFLLCL